MEERGYRFQRGMQLWNVSRTYRRIDARVRERRLHRTVVVVRRYRDARNRRARL